MNYIGSKYSLLDFLDNSITDITKLFDGVFCDLFAGTGVVGLRFKKKGFHVISNDIQYYSYALNKQLIENHTELKFEKLKHIIELPTPIKVCEYLNNIKGIRGFIYENYSLGGTELKEFARQYFTDVNAKKCDAIRDKIEVWKKEDLIDENEYWFLIASLLDCVDKVANTTSVYGAFLKKIKRSAQNEFILKPAPLFINEKTHNVYNKNANDLVREISADIFYIDPPYNHRQYATNYHILETIALNDNPQIKGKTGLRVETTKSSKYCSKQYIKSEFRDLIKNINAKYIFVSYNNEGLLSKNDIKEILSSRGEYGVVEKKYKRFQADLDKNRNIHGNNTIEYLHYVRCI